MKGEVICQFRDKFHYNTIYEIGSVVDFDEERMADLFARKLCKKIEGKEETPSPKSDKEEEKKPVAKKEAESKADEPAEATEAEATEEQSDVVLDEKAKSEQEAAKKIAEAVKKSKK